MTAPAEAAPMREDVKPGDRFRHVKRGTEYEIVGVAQLQTTDPLFDDSVMVVYRGEDGQLWTREVHEFLDRRFERLAHTARPDAGDEDVERVAKAMYDACMAKRYEGTRIPQWPPMREVAKEWLEHARAALAAMREGGDRGMVERALALVRDIASCEGAYKGGSDAAAEWEAEAVAIAAALSPEQPR